MRKNLGPKGYLYPQPVLIIGSYDENGVPDAMNAAWGGISEFHQVSICLSPEHKTVKNILKTREFTVSMADAAHVAECDYVGIVSANDVPDKLARAGLHTTKSENINAPLIDELALALECKMLSYNEETCIMVGEIINVSVDDSVLTEDGKINVAKLDPITFDESNMAYLRLGSKAGDAFAEGKKIQ